MKFRNSYLSFFVISLFTFLGCQKVDKESVQTENTVDSTSIKLEVSTEIINEVIESIPSPLEMSSIVHSVEPTFNGEFLHTPSNSGIYSTEFQKAVNIGIYATDIGFINIYNDKKDAVVYLDAMIKLAVDLKIAQFFNYESIKRLATTRKNLDSLLYVTTNDFDNINLYLQDQKRGDISLMILVGGWIEAMYILSNIAEKDHSPALYERIGEQKIVLDQLKMLLNFYKSNVSLNNLNFKLDELKTVYDRVKTETEFHKPSIEVVNGIKMVTDNNKTVTRITKQEIDDIFKIVSAIRKELIQ